MKRWIIIAALVLGLAASANAQKKEAVFISCAPEDDDTVGMRVCTELRDALATSPRYRETSDTKALHWALHVVSVGIGQNNNSSAASVTITVGSADIEYFVTAYVMTTPQSRIAERAQTILAALDKTVNAHN